MCWCTPNLRTPFCGKLGCTQKEVREAIYGWLTSADSNQLRADSHLYQPLRYAADDAMAEEDAARCALLTVCGE